MRNLRIGDVVRFKTYDSPDIPPGTVCTVVTRNGKLLMQHTDGRLTSHGFDVLISGGFVDIIAEINWDTYLPPKSIPTKVLGEWQPDQVWVVDLESYYGAAFAKEKYAVFAIRNHAKCYMLAGRWVDMFEGNWTPSWLATSILIQDIDELQPKDPDLLFQQLYLQNNLSKEEKLKQDLTALIRGGEMIVCIKTIREVLSLSLYDAKTLYDNWAAEIMPF